MKEKNEEKEKTKWKMWNVPPSLLKAAGRTGSLEGRISAYDVYAGLRKKGFADVMTQPDWEKINGVPLGLKTFTFCLKQDVRGRDGQTYSVSVRLLWDRMLIPANADALGGRIKELKDALVEIIREHIAPAPQPQRRQPTAAMEDRMNTSAEYDRLYSASAEAEAEARKRYE